MAFAMVSQLLDFFEMVLFEEIYGEEFSGLWRGIIFVGINMKLILCVLFWKVYFR